MILISNHFHWNFNLAFRKTITLNQLFIIPKINSVNFSYALLSAIRVLFLISVIYLFTTVYTND